MRKGSGGRGHSRTTDTRIFAACLISAGRYSYDDVLAFETSLGKRFDWVLHVGDFGIWHPVRWPQ